MVGRSDEPRSSGIWKSEAMRRWGRTDCRRSRNTACRNVAQAFAKALQQVLAVPGDRAAVRRFAERYGWAEPVALLTSVFRSAFGGGR